FSQPEPKCKGIEADKQEVLPGETSREEAEATQEKVETNVIHSDINKDVPGSSQLRNSMSPHDCPDCEKKFKFASSLIAHRVIHTGERPHQCNECGRCFSFRQSLDRHKHTHKTGRKYDCVICGESFHSLSARTEHNR
uniref:C2H2-type domain-containing protein n=1 Tax=Anabas testudineus TaxID=64144 RepID=A0A7N5ZPW7_ANATE